MITPEWILGGGIISLIGLILKNNYDNDKKINRLYSRLDETKQKQEDTYTRKDVCAILHTQVHNDLAELKSDMKLLLKQNGIQK